MNTGLLLSVGLGSLHAGGEGGPWATYLAQQEHVLAGCWHPISQLPRCSGEGVQLEKSHPCHLPMPLLILPVASPASTPVNWLEQCASGSPSSGSKKGIQDVQLKVDETLTHLASQKMFGVPRFAWVCNLVTGPFVPRRVPFVRLYQLYIIML